MSRAATQVYKGSGYPSGMWVQGIMKCIKIVEAQDECSVDQHS